ncbi:MAG: bifunctional DNA primase/polymerase [Steroidobacteraceae bacterium]
MQNAEILDPDDSPRKTAALALLERGFHVFAVRGRDKTPDRLLAPEGFKNATQDAGVVAGWFDVKPKANIGVACHADYGLVVIDIDVKHGAPGMSTYAELGLGNYNTLTARTPSGGYHLYFKHPGIKLRATLPGVDIKGADGGGYVLAPPSAIPEGAYTWLDAETPVAEMPFELTAMLEADQPKPPRERGASPVDELKTPAGSRHTRLKELAGVYRGKGLEAHEVEALLWWHAERYFEPPFARENADEAREIEQLAFWIGKKPAGDEARELVVLTTAELMQRAAETPPANLIEPLLPPAGNLMVHGASGVGKSHLGLCLALAAARGTPLLEWTVPAPVLVLFIDGEMPLFELKARLDTYLHGEAPPERLYWIAARASDNGDLPDLADAKAQDQYLEAISAIGAQLVVFDNLSCLRTTSADSPENSVEAWYPIASYIRRLNGLGVAVVLIHHSAKSGTQRGSSAHVAVFDTVLAVRAPGEGQADPLAENDIELVFEKHRRFGGEAARAFRAKAIGDADGYCTWQSAGTDPLLDDVVRLHKSGHSIRDMAAILKRSKAAIEKAIGRAKAAGKWPLGESA